MSWIDGNQTIKKSPSTWEYLQSLKGDLNEIEAKITLAKFFKSNIGVLFEMLSHQELLPIQEIILRSLFIRDNGIIVAARGFSKSWLLGVCSLLVPILSPGSAVCLISANFRGARRILEGAEKIINSPQAELLHECFPTRLRRQNDLYKLEMPTGSEVFALPLNAEGLRGHRANWLFVDEGLLISKEVQENILRPFLAVKQNAGEEMKIRAKENEMIDLGVITEKDRISFPNNKFFILSSASFQFQYLYELYSSFIDNIMKPKPDVKEEDRVSYFAMRFSYKVLEELPNHAFLDMTQINAAKENGGEFTDYFQREYMASFPDISDGYFNIKKMEECTVKFGEEPTVQLRGDKDSKYILTIDPSYSSSKSSDFFGMGVYLLAPEERKCFLVHTYAKSGGEISEHYLYLCYLLTHFNVVLMGIDASGDEFLKGFNESTIAKERNLKVDFLDVDLEKEQNEYQMELSEMKKQYNLTSRKIVYRQPFTSNSIRKMNEHLKNKVDAKKIWFASRMSVDDTNTAKAGEIFNSFKLKNKNDSDFAVADFIDDQNYWIDETKSQTALIQVKATPLGTLQFDLPQSIRRSTNENRPRKDNYTCLLMGSMLSSHYYNMVFAPDKVTSNTFTPFVGR